MAEPDTSSEVRVEEQQEIGLAYSPRTFEPAAVREQTPVLADFEHAAVVHEDIAVEKLVHEIVMADSRLWLHKEQCEHSLG